MNAQIEAHEDTNDARHLNTARYARAIKASQRARWDIDIDVIRGRNFDLSLPFLPPSLSLVDELRFLGVPEKKLLSQVQGRTYAMMFGLVERYINAKVLEISRDHWFGNQTALLALVRFTEEELKHQELFRQIEGLMNKVMPAGYVATANANDVAQFVLGKSTWAVLALTCCIELFTQQHYTASIEPDSEIAPLWKDTFMFHWREECQHAILDELEWQRVDARLSPEERDRAVIDLIELVAGVDGILQAQAAADVEYFCSISMGEFTARECAALAATVLKAYRWQYIGSGVRHPHFLRLLTGFTNAAQMERITRALTPILAG